LLEWQKQAHATRGRVERAHEGHDEQRPKVVEQREARARGGHQQRRADQQTADFEAMCDQPDTQS